MLNRAVAVHVVVEARAVATLLHDLTQQPLGLPAGGGVAARVKKTEEQQPPSTRGSTQKPFLFAKGESGVQVIQEVIRGLSMRESRLLQQ